VSVSAAEIEATLRAALAPDSLAVVDDSHLHAVTPAPAKDATSASPSAARASPA
jgi:stress-induced morphogen